MSQINLLITIFKRIIRGSKGQLHEGGLCPNCWGHQAYDGMYCKSFNGNPIDLKNILAKRGFIQAFVTKHIDGIK